MFEFNKEGKLVVIVKPSLEFEKFADSAQQSLMWPRMRFQLRTCGAFLSGGGSSSSWLWERRVVLLRENGEKQG